MFVLPFSLFVSMVPCWRQAGISIRSALAFKWGVHPPGKSRHIGGGNGAVGHRALPSPRSRDSQKTGKTGLAKGGWGHYFLRSFWKRILGLAVQSGLAGGMKIEI